MFVINTAALVILGVLLLRKVVLMERYFEVRVYLITAFLCGLLLFFVVSLIAAGEYHCGSTPPCEADIKVAFCAEY